VKSYLFCPSPVCFHFNWAWAVQK